VEGFAGNGRRRPPQKGSELRPGAEEFHPLERGRGSGSIPLHLNADQIALGGDALSDPGPIVFDELLQTIAPLQRADEGELSQRGAVPGPGRVQCNAASVCDKISISGTDLGVGASNA